MNTLVIAEHDNSSLKGATLNTIAAAGIVSGDVTIIIAGQDIGSVIEEAQTLDGVNKILKCDNDHNRSMTEGYDADFNIVQYRFDYRLPF